MRSIRIDPLSFTFAVYCVCVTQQMNVGNIFLQFLGVLKWNFTKIKLIIKWSSGEKYRVNLQRTNNIEVD